MTLVLQRILLFILCVSTALPYPLVARAGDNEPSSAEISSEVLKFAESTKEFEQSDAAAGADPSLDTFRVLDQVVRPSKKRGRILKRDVWVRQSADGKAVEIMYQGEPVHAFRMQAASVLLVDGYVVILEKNTFIPETGVQNVSFIDLNYFENALGETVLPVFRVPLKADKEVSSLVQESPEKGEAVIHVGSQKITSELLKFVSERLFQPAYNVTVNLVDPATYADAGPVVDSFEALQENAMKMAAESQQGQLDAAGSLGKQIPKIYDSLKSSLDHRRHTGPVEKLKEGVASLLGKSADDEVAAKIAKDFGIESRFQESIKEIAGNMKVQRKLLNRIGMLWARMSLPRPEGASKLVEALVMVREGLQARQSGQVREGFLRAVHQRNLKYGTAAAAAAVLAAAYPVAVSEFLFRAFDITRSIIFTVFGKGHKLAKLGGAAVIATAAGFNPIVFHDAYLTPEALPKVGVALTAIVTTLYLALGVPHLVVNVVKLVQDLRKANFEEIRQEPVRDGGDRLSFIAALKKAFISRQRKEQEEYLRIQSESQAKQRGDTSEFTAEENAEAEKQAEELEAKHRTWFGVAAQKIGETADKINQSELVGQIKQIGLVQSVMQWKVVQKYMDKSPSKVESLGGAMIHFLFSYASFTNAGIAYTKMWNSWFGLRSFVWVPTAFYTFIAYPTYFRRLTSADKGMTIPSVLNGGKANVFEWLKRRFLGKEALENLERWEEAIVPVEQMVQERCLRKAFEALILHIKDPKILGKFFEQNGVKSVTDKGLDSLSREERAFFRLYFDRLFDVSMAEVLAQAAGRPDLSNLPGDASVGDILRELKDQVVRVQGAPKVEVTPAEAQDIVDSFAKSRDVYDYAKREAAERLTSADSWIAYYGHGTLKTLDPTKNRQVSRIMAVNKQMKNPQAMGRAVRSMIASNLVDKPQELLMDFICLAGIHEGLLKPIQDQMFSDNSWFYLSKYVFVTGYLYGVISGVLADTWTKLQQDEQNEGSFDDVPDGKDAEMSFFRYQFKQTFQNPKNTLMKNQLHCMKIMWANMRAAFTTMLIVNVFTLGRFDLDAYLLGYLLAYAIPTGGFAFQLEQGFELASAHVLSSVPKRLRAHPRILEAYGKILGVKRIKFNVGYKLYENLLGDFITNFQTMSTAMFGTRSLARILFGGYMSSEGFSWLNWWMTTKGLLPGPLKYLMNGCEKLLLNKNTDAVILPPKH